MQIQRKSWGASLEPVHRNNPQEFWGLYMLLVTISERYASKAFSARMAPPASLGPAASSFTRRKQPRTGKSENQPPDYNPSLPNPMLASPLHHTFCMLETKFYLTLQPMTQPAGHIHMWMQTWQWGSRRLSVCSPGDEPLSIPTVQTWGTHPHAPSVTSLHNTSRQPQKTRTPPPVTHPGSVLNMEMFRGQFPLCAAKKQVQKVWNSNKVTGSCGGMQTAAVLIKKFTMSHRPTYNTQHILTRQVSIQKYTRWHLVFQRLQGTCPQCSQCSRKGWRQSIIILECILQKRSQRHRVYKMYFTWQDNKQVYKERKSVSPYYFSTLNEELHIFQIQTNLIL